jgi:ABC-type Co2+ transport system permease subunit
MHIEPGVLAHTKTILASVAAAGVLAAPLRTALLRPTLLLRTLLAASFFTLFMQAFHLPVGASELHFIGAMPIYLTLGFVPTLLGFGLGLLAQGLIFEPADLVHLGVNTLSLVVPLMVVHGLLGKSLARLDVRTILKLDATYYTGVTLMVGFWLSMAEVAVPLSAWASFAASYLAIVAIEPLLTFVTVNLLRPHGAHPVVRTCFDLAGRP